jgi:LPS-assembly lipoprotein
MWSSRQTRGAAAAALVGAAILLAACGFRPLYGRAVTGAPSGEIAAIVIEPIADRSGQQLHNHLLDLLTPAGRPRDGRYSLHVDVTESVQRLAVRKSEFATRANLRSNARFILVSRAGEGDGEVLLIGLSRTVTSFNILLSEFGTLMAEKDAQARAMRQIAEDIRDRVAVYFAQRGATVPRADR